MSQLVLNIAPEVAELFGSTDTFAAAFDIANWVTCAPSDGAEGGD